MTEITKQLVEEGLNDCLLLLRAMQGESYEADDVAQDAVWLEEDIRIVLGRLGLEAYAIPEEDEEEID